MKLPNWFKISYWILLVGIISYFFVYEEHSQIREGNLIYLFIFLIWTALLLLPFFNEFKFFGIELKGQVEELKKEVSSLKMEVQNKNSQEMRVNFNPSPPSDKVLKMNEQRIKEVLEETLKAQGIAKATIQELTPPDVVSYLFYIRYNIEKEIRRIYKSQFSIDKKLPLIRLLQELKDREILENKLYYPIRDIYSITSPAVHGEEESVTNVQVEYVKTVAPELISALKEMKE